MLAGRWASGPYLLSLSDMRPWRQLPDPAILDCAVEAAAAAYINGGNSGPRRRRRWYNGGTGFLPGAGVSRGTRQYQELLGNYS